MDYGSISGYVILAVILGGFVVMTILMEFVGKKFTWHKELD
ncbi:MAG TPA: hypothetical protein VMC48_01410 [Methanobacterium sp.]|nr:hypothetical protein [Methanobacterium sp.]